MARQRSPDRDKAFEMYKASKGEKPLVEIAEELGISEGTVRGWKNKDKWNDKLNGTFHKNEKNAPNNTERSNKTGAPLGNKNALGNKGGNGAPKGNKHAQGHGAPKQNSNAVTHGFFRKHFPDDVADLAAEIMEKNPIDMLWENITIQYTAIIRAQRLMFVESKDEMIKELKKSKYDILPDKEKGFTQVPTEEEYEFQFAWDRHATFLNAQSRAMSTLSSLIKDFDKLANVDDERRSKLNLIQAQIDKVKADTARIKGEDGEEYEDDGFKEALEGKVEEVWDDHDDDTEA